MCHNNIFITQQQLLFVASFYFTSTLDLFILLLSKSIVLTESLIEPFFLRLLVAYLDLLLTSDSFFLKDLSDTV
jgi:hypothetical protein